MTDDDPRHGTNAGHHAGCRQTCCTEARNRYERNGRKRREVGRPGIVPSVGSRRRVQALMAMGWTQRQIAQRCGLASQQVVDKILRESDTTRISTALRIAAVYEALSMTHGPSEITRRRAARNGWPTPLAWDDIDNPSEQPAGIRGNEPRDLLAEWAELEAACESIHEAARRLGVTVGAIERAKFRAARKVVA